MKYFIVCGVSEATTSIDWLGIASKDREFCLGMCCKVYPNFANITETLKTNIAITNIIRVSKKEYDCFFDGTKSKELVK